MFAKLKPKSDFSRNILTLMTGTTIAQAIPIAISPILTRIYTPEDFGIFAFYIAISSIFGSIATGRYELAIMLPRKDEDAINIFALGFIITLMISLVLLILILVFNEHLTYILRNEEISMWLYFIPITVFFTGLWNLLNYFNNRRKKYKDIANAIILKSIMMVIIQLSVGFFKQGAMGLISGQIFSQFIANTKLIKNIIKDKILLSSIQKVKIIFFAKKYRNFPKFQAPHALLNTFSSNIPIYMFSIFFNSIVVGLYTLSTRIVLTPLMILAGASAKVYNQKVSELYNNKEDSYGFTLKLLITLFKKIIIPFLIIVIFAPEFFGFLFGVQWIDAGLYTQILSPWLLMVFFASSIAFIPSLLDLQKQALQLEIIYTLLRLLAFSIGIYYHNIYVALGLFSFVGFLMLSYNMHWMLHSLKRVQ